MSKKVSQLRTDCVTFWINKYIKFSHKSEIILVLNCLQVCQIFSYPKGYILSCGAEEENDYLVQFCCYQN